MSIKQDHHHYPSGQRLEIIQGDITDEKTGAIVNAANNLLQHGGGVAAAIVRRAGTIVQEESNAWVRRNGPLNHAEPAYTDPGSLNCRFIIHAVGPVWGAGDEDRKLASAIMGSLVRAEQLALDSIAFPPISTGIFGFPKERAAGIFFTTFKDYYHSRPASPLALIHLTILDDHTLKVFLDVFNRWKIENPEQTA